MNKEHWKIKIIRECIKLIEGKAKITRDEKKDAERTIRFYKLGEEFEKERILKLGDKIFVSDYSKDNIKTDEYDYANEKWKELKQVLGEKDE